MPVEAFEDLAEHIIESLDKAVDHYEFQRNELVIYVKAEEICRVLQFLRDDKESDFKTLIDVLKVSHNFIIYESEELAIEQHQ